MKQFSSRMDNMGKSFIREILVEARGPGKISFAGGLPHPDFFPVADYTESAVNAFVQHGRELLQYSASQGYAPLREFIAERYTNKVGIDVAPEDVLITSGSQQGLDLTCRMLLNAGDKLIVESPTFLGAIHTFKMYQPQFLPVSLKEGGCDMDALAAHCADPLAKAFYYLPNFQNPTGYSYSLKKRKEVNRILQESGTYYMEDDPYYDLRFTGEDLPTLRHLDNKNGVLLGSFSKIAAPGMRVGWAIAPPDLMEKLIIGKQGVDLHTSQPTQVMLHEYLKKFPIDDHIALLRREYKVRRDLMADMIDELFPKEITYSMPDGGMFFWLTLPDHVDTMPLLAKAKEQDVFFVPGSLFHIDGTGNNTMRLNFSNTTLEQIKVGMERLATVLREGI